MRHVVTHRLRDRRCGLIDQVPAPNLRPPSPPGNLRGISGSSQVAAALVSHVAPARPFTSAYWRTGKARSSRLACSALAPFNVTAKTLPDSRVSVGDWSRSWHCIRRDRTAHRANWRRNAVLAKPRARAADPAEHFRSGLNGRGRATPAVVTGAPASVGPARLPLTWRSKPASGPECAECATPGVVLGHSYAANPHICSRRGESVNIYLN